ncbi:hypothetical protein FSARC_14773 [Fusarium sarcochroum]|uniref:Azaphilone pigments biosynthesis cluster protein L N-terminal domain-containing protein n=1 Tax=Fusarium sarcochroum TaxID=1208366 RepID=A0A8H4SR83_9HYPO|nr:hypothetical protein FSARC_14773 [Fusarium sarcochroum]
MTAPVHPPVTKNKVGRNECPFLMYWERERRFMLDEESRVKREVASSAGEIPFVSAYRLEDEAIRMQSNDLIQEVSAWVARPGYAFLIDFRTMLATYKSTINIALANANLCVAATPPEVLENYKDMISDSEIDLDDYLRGVQEKLDRLQAGDVTVAEVIAGECHAMLEEKKSAQQGLELCTRLSTQITQFDPTKL